MAQPWSIYLYRKSQKSEKAKNKYEKLKKKKRHSTIMNSKKYSNSNKCKKWMLFRCLFSVESHSWNISRHFFFLLFNFPVMFHRHSIDRRCFLSFLLPPVDQRWNIRFIFSKWPQENLCHTVDIYCVMMKEHILKIFSEHYSTRSAFCLVTEQCFYCRLFLCWFVFFSAAQLWVSQTFLGFCRWMKFKVCFSKDGRMENCSWFVCFLENKCIL